MSSSQMVTPETDWAYESVAQLERDANALAEAGHLTRAAEVFAKAACVEPRNARLHESHAQCLLASDLFGAARDAATRSVRLEPHWAPGHATLGRAYLSGGALQDAVESLERAAQLATSVQNATAAQIELASELSGELDEAKTLLEQHWAEHHDVVLRLPRTPCGLAAATLHIRQALECRYCNLCSEQGPGGALWAAGVVLASLAAFGSSSSADRSSANSLPGRGARILELGSGTGVAGIVFSAMGAAEVLLTDREPLVPLMQLNIKLNCRGTKESGEGRAECLAFDWLNPAPARVTATNWDVIIAADLVYSFHSVPLFVNTLASLLQGSTNSKSPGGQNNQPLTAIYAHNPRSDELDEQLHTALAAASLKVKILPPPRELLFVGHIGKAILQKVKLMEITATTFAITEEPALKCAKSP